MLFLLVMKVIYALIHKAAEWSLFLKLGVWYIPYHTSLYADDLILFLSSVA
jgi:hypothetical protein